MAIVIDSTTDSPETVAAVLAGLEEGKETAESKAQEKSGDPEGPEKSGEEPASDDPEEPKAEAEEPEDQGDEDDKESEEEKKPKKKGGFQKRIDRMNQKLSAIERENAELKAKLTTNKPDESGKATAKAADPSDKPKADDYDSYSEYVEALSDWKADQRDKAREAKEKASSEKSAFETKMADYAKRIDDVKAKNPDFQDLIDELDDDGVRLAPDLVHSLLDSEYGAEISYELAKNRKELERINALSGPAVARAIGRLEAKFSTDSSQEIKPKTSKAPPPLKPVGGKTGSVVKSINDPNLTFAEYEKLRLAEMKKRA